jgi:SAM-dependent methyltransferase
MSTSLQQVFQLGPVRRVARDVSNWVDLQWKILDDQLRAIAPRSHGRLLDVGCGEKPHEHIFRPYVEEYVGVEYADTFTRTDSSARTSKPDCFYDGKVLPFEARSFDTVISVQVLEHTPQPQNLLNEIGRVVRKGGLVVVTAPFSFRLHEEPHDYFRYTVHGLTAMFDAAGLVVDGIWPQGDLWTVLGHKLNSYLAFRVARIDAVAQAMGKLGHESTRTASPRYWSFPVVLPVMGAISAAARVLDKIAPDGTETLNYLAFGHPR